MLTQQKIQYEARKLRIIFDKHKGESIGLINDNFPIMHCKLASLLLAYHFLNDYPDITIYGVCGVAKNKNKEETISHYWLEINDIAIDITSDQYNTINDSELNKAIINKRPFDSVYIGKSGTIPSYKLFRIKYKDMYTKEFSELSENFLHDLKTSYQSLIKLIPS
ncbi:hypothetical protein JCM14076_17020 [Methylosoma difficile]